jgi:hypothetical protein
VDCNFGQIEIKNCRVKIMDRNFKITGCKFGQFKSENSSTRIADRNFKTATSLISLSPNFSPQLAIEAPASIVFFHRKFFIPIFSFFLLYHALRAMLDLSLGGIQNLLVSA